MTHPKKVDALTFIVAYAKVAPIGSPLFNDLFRRLWGTDYTSYLRSFIDKPTKKKQPKAIKAAKQRRR